MKNRNCRHSTPSMLSPRMLIGRVIIVVAIIGLLLSSVALSQESDTKPKVLMVVTSNNQLNDGSDAGYYLPEAVDCYVVLKKYGYTVDDIDVVSPQGGMAPMYQRSRYLGYPPFRQLGERNDLLEKFDNTLTPDVVEPAEYRAIFYVGGFASLFDYPHDVVIADLARMIYEQGGVIAAVCHGPSGLLPIRLSDGKRLIEGKKITARSIEEETNNGQISRENVLYFFPFILEEELAKYGAVIEKGPSFVPNVVVSDRVVTGQNAESATATAEAMMGLLNQSVADAPHDHSATTGMTLAQSEPNPVISSTVIRYTLPERSHVRMHLYDAVGRVVATLVDGEMDAGGHAVTVDRSGLSDGIYLYRLEAGGVTKTRSMIVAR